MSFDNHEILPGRSHKLAIAFADLGLVQNNSWSKSINRCERVRIQHPLLGIKYPKNVCRSVDQVPVKPTRQILCEGNFPRRIGTPAQQISVRIFLRANIITNAKLNAFGSRRKQAKRRLIPIYPCPHGKIALKPKEELAGRDRHLSAQPQQEIEDVLPDAAPYAQLAAWLGRHP